MMRHVDKVWKAVKLVSSARDLAIETRRLEWNVTAPNTFFLQAEHADISLVPNDRARITAEVELPLGIGWQLATDQNEAGVYIVSKRKPVIGSIGRAKFTIGLPPGIHISLKLDHCQLCLDDLYTSLELPPLA